MQYTVWNVDNLFWEDDNRAYTVCIWSPFAIYWACLGWTVLTDISWKVTETGHFYWVKSSTFLWNTDHFLFLVFYYLGTLEDSDKCNFSLYPNWKCWLAFLWSLEVISKRGHRFCYQGYVPQVMGSALLSQIQSQAVDGIIATGCSTHTRTLSHRQETEKKAVATATKGLIKGLWSCVHTRLHLWA